MKFLTDYHQLVDSESEAEILMYTLGPVTDRVANLKERIRNRVIQIDSERARIITESYQRNECITPIIKRALSTHDVCSKMTVWVDDQIFVGARGTRFCGASVNPEWAGAGFSVDMVESGLWKIEKDGLYHSPDEDEVQVAISPEDFEYLAGIRDYWKDHTVGAAAKAWQPPGFDEFAELGATTYEPAHEYILIPLGHLTPGYEKIIKLGYGAIRKQATDWLEAHRGKAFGEDMKKFLFYQSAEIATDAAATLANRYSVQCLKVAATTEEPKRKAELEMMGNSLAWISENPARTFWEALQAALLYILVLHLDSAYPAISLGRVDQYTWPLLKRELDEGTTTLEQAQELVDLFILKANQYYDAAPPYVTQITGVGNTYQHITVGGVDPDTGEDASNPVTFMLLETIARLELHDPTISFRANKNTPDELWDCAIEVSRWVGGLPLYQNDEVIIPNAMERLGFSLRDARDYSLIGCQEIVGSGNDYPAPNGIHPPNASIHYGVCLAIALNNGVNPFNGVDSGVRTGYLSEMKSFEEVRDAYYKITEYVFNWYTTMQNYSEYLTMYSAPHAALSISMEGCMESGKDCTVGGCKYNSYGGTATGLATIGDSLAAIKYMIFDNKLCTAQELYDAVMADWEGYEDLRQTILSEVPHYGNDDAYADEQLKYAIDVYTGLCDEVWTIRSPICKPGLYGAADHVSQGYHTWATPDGRRSGEPLADAISPVQGSDSHGPISIFNSCRCFDHGPFMDGMALNIRLHPSALSREDGARKLRDMTKAYFDNGGLEVQYNVVSSETLRAAQEDPDSYKNLVVRIAGYSAYFVDMNPDLQNDIIARTENQIA
jgi:formate C-acetyltransferase